MDLGQAMKSPPCLTEPSREARIAALIETLHDTEQQLEALTAGQVDTVANRAGRTLLLRGAQEQLRHREENKQAALLNALPAHIALLDAKGKIVAVNAAWRRFANENGLRDADHSVGRNYLDVCDTAPGAGAADVCRGASDHRAPRPSPRRGPFRRRGDDPQPARQAPQAPPTPRRALQRPACSPAHRTPGRQALQ